MQALYRSSKVSIERGDETRVITQPPSGPPPIPEDAVRPASSNAPPPEKTASAAATSEETWSPVTASEETSSPAAASVDAYARLAAGHLRPSTEELFSLHSIDGQAAVTETDAGTATGASLPDTGQPAGPSHSYIRDLLEPGAGKGLADEKAVPSAFGNLASTAFEPGDAPGFRPSTRGYLIFWALTLGSFFALAYLLSP